MAREKDTTDVTAQADDTVIGGPTDRAGHESDLSDAEVQQRLWSQPGGEELAMREAVEGTEADTDGQTDAVERETPAENIRRISDPSIRSDQD